MRKKYYLILWFTFFFSGNFFSQGEIYDTIQPSVTKKAHNAFYAEVLGNSGFYSLNYERFIIDKPRFKFFSRVGFGAFPFDKKHVNQYFVLEENFCFGRNNGFLEVGVGPTVQRKWVNDCPPNETTQIWDNLYWGIFRVGFRLQSEEKGSVFRAGITPSFYYKDKCESLFKFFPFGGFSYGIIF